MSIGKRLKELIDKKGVTAYIVADETGISQSTLSRIINKNSKPNASNLKALLDYFKVDRQWLITGENEIESKMSNPEVPSSNLGLATRFKNQKYQVL